MDNALFDFSTCSFLYMFECSKIFPIFGDFKKCLIKRGVFKWGFEALLLSPLDHSKTEVHELDKIGYWKCAWKFGLMWDKTAAYCKWFAVVTGYNSV